MQQITPLSRRSFLRSTSMGALALTAAGIMPIRALAASAADPAQMVLDWSELAPGFWAIADTETGGNTLLVVSDSKALLIDTKFPFYAGAILADAASQLGADTTDDGIELTLINTHHHGDHTGGNAIIVPSSAASYAHANALPRIKEQFQRYQQGAQAGPSQLSRSGASDTLIAFAKQAAELSETWTEKTAVPKIGIDGSGNTLSVGSVKVSTHHFGPGHTDNDLVIHMPEHNIIHAGDLLFNKLHPFIDASAGATARGWIVSLRAMRKLCDEETTVIPGHGEIAGAEIIDTQITYFESLISEVQTEIGNGSDRETITAMSWSFMDGLGFEQIRARAIGAVYDELTGADQEG